MALTDQQRAARQAYILSMMRDGGLTSGDAELVMDVTVHACEEALATLRRCTDVLPDYLQIYALAIGTQQLQAAATIGIDIMKQMAKG